MHNTDMLTIRRSADRGHANHGWLDARHSFSFADYHDPEHLGFRSLRVINEDRIAPQGGFPTHPHRDMEIFSYMVEGELAHCDSLGNERRVGPGQIQVMSAGSGVTHSEFNPSPDTTAHLLQIWILPKERELEPRYSESQPASGSDQVTKTLLISADGRENSATIAQNVDVWRILLEPNESLAHELKLDRGAWLQVIKGTATFNHARLEAGDAASTESAGTLEITADDTKVEALLFDLG